MNKVVSSLLASIFQVTLTQCCQNRQPLAVKKRMSIFNLSQTFEPNSNSSDKNWRTNNNPPVNVSDSGGKNIYDENKCQAHGDLAVLVYSGIFTVLGIFTNLQADYNLQIKFHQCLKKEIKVVRYETLPVLCHLHDCTSNLV